MALDILTPTRRGLLGFFAAAVPVAALSASPVMVRSAPDDWRTKPVERWTRADEIAEAEFQVADHKRKLETAFKPDASYSETQRLNGLLAGKKWWELELMQRQGRFL